MNDREKWLKQCEGFGWDDRLGSGFQANSELCLACKDSQPDRYAACKAEAEAGRKKSKKENIVEEEKTDQQVPVTTSTDIKEEKTSKPVKADRPPSVPKLIAEVLTARVPVTSKEIIEAVLAKNPLPRKGVAGTVSARLQFGILIGAIKKEDGKFSLTF